MSGPPWCGARPHQQLVAQAEAKAVQLVCDVRDVDPKAVWRGLQVLCLTDPPLMIATAVALAAMVPTDKTVRELLAWTDSLHVKQSIHRSSPGNPQAPGRSFDEIPCT